MEKPSPDANELSSRILSPLLWYLQDHLGQNEANASLEEAGLTQAVFDEVGWLSHESFEAFIAACRKRLGSSTRFVDACLHHPRRAYGPLLVVFPFLSGRQVYETVGRTMSLVSRISRYEVEARSDRDIVLRYFSQRAESRLMCLTRRAQLPVLTNLVGLPSARLTETSCIGRGDACCTYRLRLRAHSRWRAMFIGGLAGLVSAVIMPRSLMTPLSALVGLPVAGFLLGGGVDLVRRFVAQRRILNETRQSGEGPARLAAASQDSHAPTGDSASGTGRDDVAAGPDAITRTRVDSNPSSPTPQLLAEGIAPGTVFDRYEVLQRIGHGGMGTVFAAHDTKLGRRVALKLLHGWHRAEEQRVTRMVREGRALAALTHPNVITVYDVLEAKGGVFLVMEYVDGTTLKTWANDHPEATDADLLPLLLQAADGLAAAHEAGLIHRDFKPSNVLVGTDGRVRVADFGLARRVETDAGYLQAEPPMLDPLSSDDPFPDPTHPDSTGTGVVAGTPRYMAPEQYEGRRLDPRCDQFAFCVVAYELLCGVHPFDGTPTDDTYRAAKAGRRAPPRKTALPALIPILARGLEANRQRRFSSMHELAEALRAAGVPNTGRDGRPGSRVFGRRR